MPLKTDSSKMKIPFWGRLEARPICKERFAVSFREGNDLLDVVLVAVMFGQYPSTGDFDEPNV